VFIVSGSMAWMFIASGYLMPAFFAVALAGACLGFLKYNYSPAKVFMGDTGSLFIGFSVAALAILTNRKGHATIGLLLPAIIGLGIPIYDTSLAFFRRLVIKRVNPFQADNEHVHHALLRLKLKHKSVVLILWALTVILNIVAVGIYYYSHKSS
jgi:UDP-GlcNAc:undecaprenyl-phosphate/decaprenyl-phosphate GlcNAc-1-phosphate transferase